MMATSMLTTGMLMPGTAMAMATPGMATATAMTTPTPGMTTATITRRRTR